MSTTAIELLTDAAATAGVIDPEESLPAGKAQFILRRLNRMIASWGNERLLIFETYVDTLPLVSGQPAYSSALLAHGNARQWDNAFVRMSDIDYTLGLVNQQRYNALADKRAPGIPALLYVAAAWPDSTLNFYPVPSDAMSAHIAARVPLTDELVLTTAVDLPPGYEAALVDNLAVDISPSFGMQPSPALVDTARRELMTLKRNNHVSLELALPFERAIFDIQAGD